MTETTRTPRLGGTRGAGRQRRRVGALLAVLAPGALGGIALTPVLVAGIGSDSPAAAAGLSRFRDCAAVRDWFVPLLANDGPAGPPGPSWRRGGPVISDLVTGSQLASAERAGGSGPAIPDSAVGPGATGSNVQESGVDEPDELKSAGGRLVTTVGDTMVVYDVTGRAPRRLGSVVLPGLAGSAVAQSTRPAEPAMSVPGSRSRAELLLVGSRVVLLSRTSYLAAGGGAVSLTAGQPTPETGTVVATTTVRIVDVAEPARPRLVGTEEVEGRLLAARAIRGSVRLVLASVPAPDPARPRTALEAAGLPGTAFLPQLITRSSTGRVIRRAPALGCADLVHPARASGRGVLSVRTLDVAGAGPGRSATVHRTGIAAEADLAYASADRLYTATTVGGWSGRRPASETVATELHGFDITDPRMTRYLASGRVPGYPLNQWSLSARAGLLRVATSRPAATAGMASSGGADAVVTILRERPGGLEPIGRVTGLGKGEQITSVRWFDEVALVVTFRQTDPLYLLDLTRPEAPLVRGELKVPGFSAYLHPVGARRILGVGRSATDAGRITGAQVSLFDLDDPSRPRRTAVLTRAEMASAVDEDARLFAYLPAQRIAVMPMAGARGTSLEAYRVGADGSLRTAGRLPLDAGTAGWPVLAGRVITVDDRRLAVVVTRPGSATLSLVAADGLHPTGAVRLE